MLSTLISRPCTITRRSSSGDLDDYGNETTTEDVVETVCELQQRQRSEPGDQAEFSDTNWVLFLLPDEAIDTSDVVTVDGHVFEMVGDPWVVRNPRTGVDSHIEATVRRTGDSEDEGS